MAPLLSTLVLALAATATAQDMPKLNATQIPDLSSIASMFPKGPLAFSPLLNPQGPVGKYGVAITTHPAFPARTIYYPRNVTRYERIPIFAWENGVCFQYGRMYAQFLEEIASHGYLVVVPGEPWKLNKTMTTAAWQMESIKMAQEWKTAPFTVARNSVGVGGHSCGGMEVVKNLASDWDNVITTGLVMNSAGKNASFDDVKAPMLWVHGGKVDTEPQQTANFAYIKENNPRLPVMMVGMQTGHLGSYWSPRGGLYAETAVKWLDWQLKGDKQAELYFTGGLESPAAKRGWEVKSNRIDY